VTTDHPSVLYFFQDYLCVWSDVMGCSLAPPPPTLGHRDDRAVGRRKNRFHLWTRCYCKRQGKSRMARMEEEDNLDGAGCLLCRMPIRHCNSGLSLIPLRTPMVGLVLISTWGLDSHTCLRLW